MAEGDGQFDNPTTEIPLDSASDYFDWLKDFHDPKRIESLPDDKPRPREFNYDGITLEEVDAALKAIQDQRAQDSEIMHQLLQDLSPAQIILLSMDPTQRIYTDQELSDLRVNKIRNEKERLLKFPDTQKVIQVSPGTIKYLHATPGDLPEYKYVGDIMTDGIHCDDMGLAGVAVGLSNEDDEYNLGVLANRHKDHPGVISIVLPIPSDKELVDKMQTVYRPGLGRVGLDSLLARELPDEKKVKMHGTGIDYDHILPGKFIEGYFDTQKGEFIKNPNFDPNLSDEDIQHIEERLEGFSS